MYPCDEVYMAYVSSGIPLIWCVKVLHFSTSHLFFMLYLKLLELIKGLVLYGKFEQLFPSQSMVVQLLVEVAVITSMMQFFKLLACTKFLN